MTPWSTREKAEQIVRFEDAAASGTPVETAPISAPRKIRINPSDLATHGYTERCAQCRHIETVGRARPGGTHSDACRKRIIEEIGKTEAGKQRLADYAERLDRAMVDFSHPADTAGDTARPPAKVELEDTAEADAYRARALEHNGPRREIPQPGRSGTGDEGGVPLSTPGSVPAACLPTPQEGGRQDAGKLSGVAD